ncbi:MAG: thioredoxin domain-containing protein [Candidatus Gottesmanbacteria bacterium]|nr:thioredoxin domain-containing protein [Candidatus Gottesmanbacteria bacterium]
MSCLWRLLAADIADGNTLGINATPTFFLNNQKIENPASLADFELLIKNARVE